MRRLPVYLLIDTSESMAGEAIKEVESGLALLVSQLRGDPHALESVVLSVITYDCAARQVSPLTEVGLFTGPRLVLGAGTSFGAALEALERCLNTEVRARTSEFKGDYAPIVFILTDGVPTDSWETVARRIRARCDRRRLLVAGIACGPDAATESLRHITDKIIVAAQADAASLKEIFRWLTMSISTASISLDKGETRLDFDRLPEVLRKAGDAHHPASACQQVFMHARCTGSTGFYVMRYRRVPEAELPAEIPGPVFLGAASHPLEAFHFDRSERGSELKVPIEQLVGVPRCPYCGNAALAFCACGGVHCCAPSGEEGPRTLTCPWCGDTAEYGTASGNFEVTRSAG
jgi:uncharacterized protein YegL